MAKADHSQDRCPRTGDLFGDLLPPPQPQGPAGGGGGPGGRPGRHRRGRGAPGFAPGGRPAPESAADIRFRELEEIGLQRVWLTVADLIGIDNFFAAWKYLSSRDELINDDNQIEIRLRRFASYQRYQRNRYIETLVRSGLKPGQVRDIVRRELGEKLSDRQARRLCSNARLAE